MVRICIVAFSIGLFCASISAAQGSSTTQTPPEQRPVNPTQEIAKEQPEGPAIEVGPGSHSSPSWIVPSPQLGI